MSKTLNKDNINSIRTGYTQLLDLNLFQSEYDNIAKELNEEMREIEKLFPKPTNHIHIHMVQNNVPNNENKNIFNLSNYDFMNPFISTDNKINYNIDTVRVETPAEIIESHIEKALITSGYSTIQLQDRIEEIKPKKRRAFTKQSSNNSLDIEMKYAVNNGENQLSTKKKRPLKLLGKPKADSLSNSDNNSDSCIDSDSDKEYPQVFANDIPKYEKLILPLLAFKPNETGKREKIWNTVTTTLITAETKRARQLASDKPYNKNKLSIKNNTTTNSNMTQKSVSIDSTNNEVKTAEIAETLADIEISSNEVIISVAIFHPRAMNKTQEFLVYGSQSLADLRDKFYCLSDVEYERSKTTGSCFFIENQLYDDTRNTDSDRISDIINDWVTEDNRFTHNGLSIYPVKSMENTSFMQLKFRLGSHYAYIHQSNCIHTIIFTDIHIHQPNTSIESRYICSYPMKIFELRIPRKRCQVCLTMAANYITEDDRLSSTNPMYWCSECYQQFHYSKDGRLLYNDFTVYPYQHD